MLDRVDQRYELQIALAEQIPLPVLRISFGAMAANAGWTVRVLLDRLLGTAWILPGDPTFGRLVQVVSVLFTVVAVDGAKARMPKLES